jgi:hypothetical protein
MELLKTADFLIAKQTEILAQKSLELERNRVFYQD